MSSATVTHRLPDGDLADLDADRLFAHAVAFADANKGIDDADRLVLIGAPARSYLNIVGRRIVDRLTADGVAVTKAEILLRVWREVDPEFPSRPMPVPGFLRALRIVFCRRCGQDTEIPGAAFCDACRPHADEVSLSEVDLDRARG